MDNITLVVAFGGTNLQFGYDGLLTSAGAFGSDNKITTEVSAFFENNIIAEANVYIFSDKRIKKNINSIEDDKALVEFRKLNPCYYEYIDKIKRGNVTTYGFLAQEVKEVLPYSCSIGVSHIPNIFTYADISGNLLIVENGEFENLDLDLKDSSGNVFKHVQIALETKS